MKSKDVPQDNDPTFEGGKKITYAVGPDGKYVPVKTSGWTVEADAKDLAWKAIDADVEECRKRVANGQASPLEYFMKLRQMDVHLLAANMGLFTFRVKWHMRRFHKLSPQWLERYAACLNVPVDTLRNYKGEPT